MLRYEARLVRRLFMTFRCASTLEVVRLRITALSGCGVLSTLNGKTSNFGHDYHCRNRRAWHSVSTAPFGGEPPLLGCAMGLDPNLDWATR